MERQRRPYGFTFSADWRLQPFFIALLYLYYRLNLLSRTCTTTLIYCMSPARRAQGVPNDCSAEAHINKIRSNAQNTAGERRQQVS